FAAFSFSVNTFFAIFLLSFFYGSYYTILQEFTQSILQGHIISGGKKKYYITSLAYKDDEIKYYSLNKEAIDFTVKGWEDFAVIAPKVNFWSIKDELSYAGEYPLISIVFSVKLSSNAFKTVTYAEKKILYKELCNKLYLLQYIELHKGIKDVLHKFNTIFNFENLNNEMKKEMAKHFIIDSYPNHHRTNQ
ncbi:MAG: hypothetical protein LBM93_04505, partial [Oscillospiraceae bacterium]|nr:hypothetical protein [Oscillospiraceae bacterium]